ncbi:MAG TPA: sigma-70 family RNA polymerase sigma factor [Candidatus Micrarchaeia archaeon]|nr:sigma-70 family RNA polymerase sigma factor [Candidatus Micrarchaeia archaeon]
MAEGAGVASAGGGGSPPGGGASDADLVRRVRAGDELALDQLFRRYAGQCLAIAAGLLGDAQQAEDVVQETFVRLWQHARTLDPGDGTVGGWCCRVARNRAIDELRARRARPQLALGVPPEGPTHDHVDTAAEALRRIRQREVRSALDQLPEPQREAVTLAFLHGLTHTELAQRLEVPLGTAKTRVRQGLLRLQTLLREPPDSAPPPRPPRAERPPPAAGSRR